MVKAAVLRRPFLVINPKAYLYGEDSLALARHANNLSERYDIDVLFTGQSVDLARIASECPSLFVCAQHMDGIKPGADVGRMLPEAMAAAGVRATFLNHAAHPLTVHEVFQAVMRAREVGVLSVVLADSIEEGEMLAHLNPDVMICELTSLIGTGHVADIDYMRNSTVAVKRVSPTTLVIQAAGIHSGKNVYDAIMLGADGSGGTSGIVNALDPMGMVGEMMEALVQARGDLARRG